MGYRVMQYQGDTLHLSNHKPLDAKAFIRDITEYLEFFRPGQTSKIYTHPDTNQTLPNINAPGIQLTLNFLRNSDSLNKLEDSIHRYLEKFIFESSNRQVENFYSSTWIYKSTSYNDESVYHDHQHFSPYEISQPTSYTWVYYLQMPDNLEGDEGKILFSRDKDDNTALKVLPQDGDVIIFPSVLPHRPLLNPNSTKSRLVVAGNIAVNFKTKTFI